MLPTPALSVLREKISKEELLEVEKITVSLSGSKPAASQEELISDQERAIRGNTTFTDLQNWGLSKNEIEQVLGIPMGRPGVTVRYHCTANEIEFGEVKVELQALVNDSNQ